MAETYSFMHIKKIKTNRSLKCSGNHNMRLGPVENADPEKIDLNESIVPTGTNKNGDVVSYNEAFKNRIKDLPFYKDHKVRSDQVKGLEVLMTFSRNAAIDIGKWKMQSMKWLHDTFDVAQDQKSNIVSAELHADENGNVHIHAFVIPIDERGHLNASRFVNGYNAMVRLQTSYAEYVKDLGISRGVKGSSAKHEDIRKMYARFNGAIKIPPVVIGESAEEYRDRVADEAETRFAGAYREAEDRNVERRRFADEYVLEQRKTANDYKSEADKERKNVAEARESLAYYEEEKDALLQQMYQLQIERQRIEEEKEKSKKYDALHKGLAVLSNENPEYAKSLENIMAELAQTGYECLDENNQNLYQEDAELEL